MINGSRGRSVYYVALPAEIAGALAALTRSPSLGYSKLVAGTGFEPATFSL